MGSKRKVGGQRGNVNALRHGGYSQRFTPDTPQGKLVRWIEGTLTTAIADPTPQEALILRRASVKAYRIDCMEREMLKGNGVSESLEKNYLRWCRELREDLKLLGLKRRAKPVQELTEYLRENYGEVR
ncbi:hypothetical protein MYX82_03765 [Acidobacteria bacterium AH-259-D05]|nr:hypothetical protein [Acidobacteria bacterium AH-259-D05]